MKEAPGGSITPLRKRNGRQHWRYARRKRRVRMHETLLLTFNAGSSTVKIGIFRLDRQTPKRIGKAVVDFSDRPLTLHLAEGVLRAGSPFRSRQRHGCRSPHRAWWRHIRRSGPDQRSNHGTDALTRGHGAAASAAGVATGPGSDAPATETHADGLLRHDFSFNAD